MKNPSQEAKPNRGRTGTRTAAVALAAAYFLAACSGSGQSGAPKDIVPVTTPIERAPQPGSVEYEQARVDQVYANQLQRIANLTEANKDRAESLAGRIVRMTPEQAKERNMTVNVVRTDEGQLREVSVIYHGSYDENNSPVDDTQRSFGIEFVPGKKQAMDLEILTMDFGKDVSDGGRLFLNIIDDDTSHAGFIGAGQTVDSYTSTDDFSPINTEGYSEGNMGAVDEQLRNLENTITVFESYPNSVMNDLEAIIPADS